MDVRRGDDVCLSVCLRHGETTSAESKRALLITAILGVAHIHSQTEQCDKSQHSSQSDHIPSGLNEKQEAEGERG